MIPEQRRAVRGEGRRSKTRSAILDAGQRLFAARAIDSVSVDDIVAAADVAKGSFYNHFEHKEGLAAAIVALVQGDCEFRIFAANREVKDAATRMVRALCVTTGYARSHPDRLQALLSLSERRTIASTPLNAGVAADVRDGIEAKRFVGVTVETGVLIALGVIRTAVAHSMDDGTQTPRAELTAMVGAALLRALGVGETEAATLAQAAVQELLMQENEQ